LLQKQIQKEKEEKAKEKSKARKKTKQQKILDELSSEEKNELFQKLKLEVK
jgi:hypothetical protein